MTRDQTLTLCSFLHTSSTAVNRDIIKVLLVLGWERVSEPLLGSERVPSLQGL